MTTGSLDLHAGGAVDLAMLNPILTAQGQRVRGEVTLDAAIAGPATAPRITGTARLAGGDAEDGPQGIHITDIGATGAGRRAIESAWCASAAVPARAHSAVAARSA